MKSLSKFFAAFLLLTQFSQAITPLPSKPGNLRLTGVKEVEVATSISEALNRVSAQVMACMERQNGNKDGCTCETRGNCPAKQEFDFLIKVFCKAMARYPEWKSHDLVFQKQGGPPGHVLSTKNLYLHFGRECR